jgi:hypothetical protein
MPVVVCEAVSMTAGSDKELIARLPRTFVPALNDQLRRWDLLFPAERRLIRAQLDWLSSLPRPEFKQLFDPIFDIEARMDLPKWRKEASTMTIEDTAIIARSPRYPEWRSRVEKAFERIDEAAESSGSLKRVPRLLICMLPSGLPPGSLPLWPDLADDLHWVSLEKGFGEVQAPLFDAIVKRHIIGLELVEGTWAMECGSKLSAQFAATDATVLSWSALVDIRREFSNRLNSIRKTLKSADETSEELKRIDLKPLLSAAMYAKPAVREFVRTLLLSGNGGLVFNNSFIQWGAVETLRRVQPQTLIASFGIRSKPKPFSSVVLLEDQARSNPVADEPDLPGSLVDDIMLSQYVHLATRRLAPYHNRTLTLLAIEDLDRVAVIQPKSAPSWPARVSGSELTESCLRWLRATA